MSRKKKPDRWSYAVGEPGDTVTVFERRPGGPLYVRIPDPSYSGGYRRESLKHRDRDKAKAYAAEQHAKLLNGLEALQEGRTPWARLFAAYQRHRTPKKGATEQKADARRIKMWTRVLGAESDPLEITLREWETFIEDRGSGAIDARAHPVPESAPCPVCSPTIVPECTTCGGTGGVNPRTPVRTRTVERDLVFLNAVCNWAAKWRTEEGRYLLPANPVRGFEVPREKNPRRAVATEDRFEATMAVAADVHPDLPALLALANGTGRRIGAIRQLRYSDILPDRGPYGTLRFRADSDKMGRESTFPLTPELRRVLDRHTRSRPGIGDAPLFPAPGDPSKPVSRHLADKWLRRAEAAAGLEPLPGKLWHAYRAKFATELLDEPDRIVARLGGWKAPRTLDIYQQPGEEAMLRALERRKELRERGTGGRAS